MFLKKLREPNPLPRDPRVTKLMQDYLALATGDGGYPRGEAENDFIRLLQDPRAAYAVVNLEERTLHIGTTVVTVRDGAVRRRIGTFIISVVRRKSPGVHLENIEPLLTSPLGESTPRRDHPHMSGGHFCTAGAETARNYIMSGNLAGAVGIYLDALYSYNAASRYYAASEWPIFEENNDA